MEIVKQSVVVGRELEESGLRLEERTKEHLIRDQGTCTSGLELPTPQMHMCQISGNHARLVFLPRRQEPQVTRHQGH